MSVNVNIHGQPKFSVNDGGIIRDKRGVVTEYRGDGVHYVLSRSRTTHRAMRGTGGWYILRVDSVVYDDGHVVICHADWPIKGNTIRTLDEPPNSNRSRVF